MEAAHATPHEDLSTIVDLHFPDTVRSLAERILRQVGNRPSQALPGFLAAIEKNRGLLSTAMMWILNEVAEDIRRADAEDSGRHIARETQKLAATGGGTSHASSGTHSSHARPALPTEAQKTGARSAMRKAAVSILDTLKIREKAIGDCSFRELKVADRISATERAVIARIFQHSPNVDDNNIVRDVISNRTLTELTKDMPEITSMLQPKRRKR